MGVACTLWASRELGERFINSLHPDPIAGNAQT